MTIDVPIKCPDGHTQWRKAFVGAWCSGKGFECPWKVMVKNNRWIWQRISRF